MADISIIIGTCIFFVVGVTTNTGIDKALMTYTSRRNKMQSLNGAFQAVIWRGSAEPNRKAMTIDRKQMCNQWYD